MKVVAAEASLKYYLPLVGKVTTQSQVRILHAETRRPGKILSLFAQNIIHILRRFRSAEPPIGGCAAYRVAPAILLRVEYRRVARVARASGCVFLSGTKSIG
ncbi:MAG: hypothetical protein JO170_24580 [Verrucomicrobia bacterium]|nr:hypothetical protein [Verrucomicrobiota bacterium]